MKLQFKDVGPILKKTFNTWMAKDPMRQSAAIAYYAIFSLPGLLVVVITVAGFFWEKDVVSSHLMEQVKVTMGSVTAEQIQGMLISASQTKESIWATIIGIVTIIIGATGVFAELQKTLNIIWEVKTTTTKKGIWPLIKTRVFSFGLILSIAFLLLISLVITTVLSAISSRFSNSSETFVVLFRIIDFLISFSVITVLFALMYKILPDAKIKWQHVWIGAMVTSFLFIIGKSLLSLYFGKAAPGTNYGAAGSIILILLWVSYSSVIFFFGAEFTHVYAERYDGVIPADDCAVKVPGRGKDV